LKEKIRSLREQALLREDVIRGLEKELQAKEEFTAELEKEVSSKEKLILELGASKEESVRQFEALLVERRTSEDEMRGGNEYVETGGADELAELREGLEEATNVMEQLSESWADAESEVEKMKDEAYSKEVFFFFSSKHSLIIVSLTLTLCVRCCFSQRKL